MSLCLEENTIEIFRGEALTLELDIFTPELRVQKLTAVDQITVTFTDQDGNSIVKLLSGPDVTVTDPEAGQMTVAMKEADTSILPEGIDQTFGVFIEYTNGDKRNVEYEKRLIVKKRTGGA